MLSVLKANKVIQYHETASLWSPTLSYEVGRSFVPTTSSMTQIPSLYPDFDIPNPCIGTVIPIGKVTKIPGKC